MCQECRMSPCHPRCPNAPEPLAVAQCAKCNSSIVVDDEYAQFDDTCYCEACLDDMSTSELVKLFGGEWKKASSDDFDDGSDDAYENYRDAKMFD